MRDAERIAILSGRDTVMNSDVLQSELFLIKEETNASFKSKNE